MSDPLIERLFEALTQPDELARLMKDPQAQHDTRQQYAQWLQAQLGPNVDTLYPRPRRPTASASAEDTRPGALTIVGTGIRMFGQLTLEALAHLKSADIVLHVVGDPAAQALLARINPREESLKVYYRKGLERSRTYEAMVQRIVGCVTAGERTCVAFYGHPGVFSQPGHEAIRRAREQGYPARMLPGISATDCLFADLGVDPGTSGLQSYEATDFLLNARGYDPSVPLILWQIGAVGDGDYHDDGHYPNRGLPLVVQRLLQMHPPRWPVYVYSAAIVPWDDPIIRQVPLAELAHFRAGVGCTLFVPPCR